MDSILGIDGPAGPLIVRRAMRSRVSINRHLKKKQRLEGEIVDEELALLIVDVACRL